MAKGRKFMRGTGSGRPEGKRLLEDLVFDGNIILKWVLTTSMGRRGLNYSGYEKVAACCKCGDEHWGNSLTM
jgi:hypothetical protein